MATTTTILRPGDIVGGFRVDDVIGIGGMAIVYRAEQVSLGRPVALKVLSSKLTNDAIFRERFRREGKHAAALEHPNIVPVYDSGEEDGLLYLAMRLVEGTNLAELIETRGLTADQTIEVLGPIASALDTAHAAGLIHRDVKPQNVLLTSQGHPYLADFGVAKGSNTYGLTATGGFVGSINYASPEQIKGLTLTPASDVYALTAVLYQCLTGSVPYRRETDAGIMHAHLNEPPPSLPTLNGADSDFHTVLARGMAKDPGARYGHAGDLLNAAALSVSRLGPAVRRTAPAFPVAAQDDASEPQASRREAAPPRAATEIVPPDELSGRVSATPHTTADQRRARAPEPKVPPPSVTLGQRHRWKLAAGAGVIGIAILLAALLGHGANAQRTIVRRGFIELTYPKPWRAAPAASQAAPGVRLADPIALQSGGSRLAAGTLIEAPSAPGSLPASVLAKLGPTPRRSTVRAGTVTGVAYRSTLQGGAGSSSILVIPTTQGDLGVLCVATAAETDSCLRIAQSIQVVGANVVPAGADPHLAKLISQSLAPSASARNHASGLASSRVSARAATARMMDEADRRTAAALAGLSPEPRDSALVGALATAVRGEASTLAALASAASRHDRPAYARSASEVHAAAPRIDAARRALVSVGFATVPILKAFPVPALPIAQHRKRQAPSAPAVPAPAPSPVLTPAPSVVAPTPSLPVSPTPSRPKPPRTEPAKPLN